MRHRETTLDTRQNVERTAWSRSYSAACNSTWTSGTPTLFGSGELYHKFVDDCEPTPGFRRMQRRGLFLPLNPFTVSTSIRDQRPGKVPHDYRRNGCLIGRYAPDWSWYYFDGEVVIPPVDPNLTQIAVNNSVADLKSATWDALTSLAEVRKSAELIESLMGQVLSIAASVAKASYASAARPTRKGRSRSQEDIWSNARLGFNRRWLESRFGIRPLVMEIDNALASIHRADDALIRGKARVTQDLSTTAQRIRVVDAIQRQTITTVVTGTRYYRGAAFGRVRSDILLRSGLSPLVTGYELIPFSFVLDWFWDIGTYLQAVDPFSGAHMIGNCASVHTSYTVVQTVLQEFHGRLPSEPSDAVHSGAGTFQTEIKLDRYDRFPHPVALPGWNVRLNPAKLLDILTIITSGKTLIARNLRGD